MDKVKLVKLLGRIQALGKEKRQPASQDQIRSRIVIPILQALGWDTCDAQMVRDQHPLEHPQAISLFGKKGGEYRLRIIIEVRELGISDLTDLDPHLFAHASQAGADLIVVTDGCEFRFCPVQASGNAHWYLGSGIDLVAADNLAAVANCLERYLSLPNTESGKMMENINADRQEPQSCRTLLDYLRDFLPASLSQESDQGFSIEEPPFIIDWNAKGAIAPARYYFDGAGKPEIWPGGRNCIVDYSAAVDEVEVRAAGSHAVLFAIGQLPGARAD